MGGGSAGAAAVLPLLLLPLLPLLLVKLVSTTSVLLRCLGRVAIPNTDIVKLENRDSLINH